MQGARVTCLAWRCMQGLPGMRAGMGPPPPPPLSDDHPAWADEVWASPLDVRRRIFCNRSLNMSQIRAVGFDMVLPSVLAIQWT